MSEVVGRTNGHLNGYSVRILHSNHRETQYSQLYSAAASIATGFEANVGDRPIDPKKAEENFLGSANDCEGISNGGCGHDPYGAVRAQEGGWKETTFRGGNVYVSTGPNVSLDSTNVHCSRRPISGSRMDINRLEVSARIVQASAFNFRAVRGLGSSLG